MTTVRTAAALALMLALTACTGQTGPTSSEASTSVSASGSVRVANADVEPPSSVLTAARTIALKPGDSITSDFEWTETTFDALVKVEPAFDGRGNHSAVYVLQVQGQFHQAMPHDANHVENWIVERLPTVEGAPAGTQSLCFCNGGVELPSLGTVHHFQLQT